MTAELLKLAGSIAAILFIAWLARFWKLGGDVRIRSEEQAREYLDELAFLAETAGAETCGRFLQKMEVPNPKTFVGTGKIDEIKNYIIEREI